MLEFSSALGTKLVRGGIRGTAGGARDNGSGRFRLSLAGTDFAPDQRIEIRLGLDALNFLKDQRGFSAHLSADFLIILFGKFAALVFEVEVLNISEHDFLLALQQIPLGFFDDCGFQRLVPSEKWNADGAEHRAAENAAE